MIEPDLATREGRAIFRGRVLREEGRRYDTAWYFREQRGNGLTGQRKLYWESNARFPVVPAGRRSGKTILSEWKLERQLWKPKPWKDARYFFAGPTQGQAEQIGWQRMVDLLQSSQHAHRIEKINLSDLIITLGLSKKGNDTYRSSFHIIGLDSPQRMEGRGWDGGIGDERADWKSGVWAANIRPSLADRSGFCYLIGTPDFEGPSAFEFKEQFEKGLRREDGYESFTWPSAEVVSAEEIAIARNDSPPNIFRQEYEASFESVPGRAYPDFTRTAHVSQLAYDASLPLFVSCDFNRVFHNWGLYQYVDGEYRVLEDLYVNGGTVEAMCGLAASRIESLGALNVTFFGDYSGDQKRAEATDSAWGQIKRVIKSRPAKDGDSGLSVHFAYAPQPPINDRIEKVNTFFLNAQGKMRIKVDSRAKNHIRDFEEVPRKMLFGSDKGGELTHASDAFGYMVWQHQKMLTSTNYFAMNAR